MTRDGITAVTVTHDVEKENVKDREKKILIIGG